VAAVVDLHGATLTFGDAAPGLHVLLDFPLSGELRASHI